MRVQRVAAVALAFGVAVGVACASTPSPRTGGPSSSEEQDEGHVPHVPHSCFGAAIKIDPSEEGRFPADALLEPELGPEPPPEPDSRQMSERPRGEWVARAIVRSVEGAVPEIRCHTYEDRSLFRFTVECGEENGCQTTAEKGQAYVERIRPLLTPVVRVGLDTCACRAYN